MGIVQGVVGKSPLARIAFVLGILATFTGKIAEWLHHVALSGTFPTASATLLLLVVLSLLTMAIVWRYTQIYIQVKLLAKDLIELWRRIRS